MSRWDALRETTTSSRTFTHNDSTNNKGSYKTRNNSNNFWISNKNNNDNKGTRIDNRGRKNRSSEKTTQSSSFTRPRQLKISKEQDERLTNDVLKRMKKIQQLLLTAKEQEKGEEHINNHNDESKTTVIKVMKDNVSCIRNDIKVLSNIFCPTSCSSSRRPTTPADLQLRDLSSSKLKGTMMTLLVNIVERCSSVSSDRACRSDDDVILLNNLQCDILTFCLSLLLKIDAGNDKGDKGNNSFNASISSNQHISFTDYEANECVNSLLKCHILQTQSNGKQQENNSKCPDNNAWELHYESRNYDRQLKLMTLDFLVKFITISYRQIAEVGCHDEKNRDVASNKNNKQLLPNILRNILLPTLDEYLTDIITTNEQQLQQDLSTPSEFDHITEYNTKKSIIVSMLKCVSILVQDKDLSIKILAPFLVINEKGPGSEMIAMGSVVVKEGREEEEGNHPCVRNPTRKQILTTISSCVLMSSSLLIAQHENQGLVSSRCDYNDNFIIHIEACRCLSSTVDSIRFFQHGNQGSTSSQPSLSSSVKSIVDISPLDISSFENFFHEVLINYQRHHQYQSKESCTQTTTRGYSNNKSYNNRSQKSSSSNVIYHQLSLLLSLSQTLSDSSTSLLSSLLLGQETLALKYQLGRQHQQQPNDNNILNSSPPSTCSCQFLSLLSKPPLLLLLHYNCFSCNLLSDSGNDTIVTLICLCINQLLRTMPLRIWLRRRTGNASISNSLVSRGHLLSDRVSLALMNMIDVISCCLHRNAKIILDNEVEGPSKPSPLPPTLAATSVDSLCNLIIDTLTVLPFTFNNSRNNTDTHNNELIHSAIQLLSLMGNLLLEAVDKCKMSIQSAKKLSVNRSAHASSHTSSSIAMTVTQSKLKVRTLGLLESITKCFIECMGGRLKPNGTSTEISPPMKIMLYSCTGRRFLNEVIDNCSSTTISTKSTKLMRPIFIKLLTAIIRAEPLILLMEKTDSIEENSWIQNEVAKGNMQKKETSLPPHEDVSIWKKFYNDLFLNYLQERERETISDFLGNNSNSISNSWNDTFCLDAFRLLESLLYGRKQYFCSSPRDYGADDVDGNKNITKAKKVLTSIATTQKILSMLKYVCSVFSRVVLKSNKSIQLCIMNIYGELLLLDWWMIFDKGGTSENYTTKSSNAHSSAPLRGVGNGSNDVLFSSPEVQRRTDTACDLFSVPGMWHIQNILMHCNTNQNSLFSLSDLSPSEQQRWKSQLEHASEVNATVRSAACKAIGNICTQCISPAVYNEQKTGPSMAGDKISATLSEIHVKCMIIEVGNTMVHSLKDSNVSVRSMALFAVGNLCQSLLEIHSGNNFCNGDPLICPFVLLRLSTLTFDILLNDTNDKVIGNAIRTIGHVSSLIYCRNDIYLRKLPGNSWDQHDFYQRLVTVLSGKIDIAVQDVSGSLRVSQLSWKQRVIAKKHGWGSCTALALILNCNVALRDGTIVQTCKGALLTMVRCLQHIGVLNEKVVACALDALRKIPSILWRTVSSSGYSIVGITMNTCLGELYSSQSSNRTCANKSNMNNTPAAFLSPCYKNHRNNINKKSDNISKKDRLHKKMYALLDQLLAIATIHDVSCLLKGEKDVSQTKPISPVTRPMLEFLYEYMIDTGTGAHAFESFALALQRTDLRSDNVPVSLQQKFGSRALQRYRLQQHQLQRKDVDDADDCEGCFEL